MMVLHKRMEKLKADFVDAVDGYCNGDKDDAEC